MRIADFESIKNPQFTRWLCAVIAVVTAATWAMLAAGAPTVLLSWVPSAIGALAFALSFMAIAVMSIRSASHTDVLLVGLSVLSLIALLYAPALAIGGPIEGAPVSVVCPSGTAICWSYLHAAFKVQAVVLIVATLLAGKRLLAGRTSGA